MLSSPRTPNPHSDTVLIVEDNQDVADVIAHHVRQLGYASQQAVSAEHALTLINQDDFAAAVIDINLGQGMNGVALILEIRTTSAQPGLGIVVCSVLDRYQLHLPDADARITKPFSTKAIRQAVQTAIRAGADRR